MAYTLSYRRRDFAKTEGRKTEKGKVERVDEEEAGGKKHSEIPERRNLARRTTEQEQFA